MRKVTAVAVVLLVLTMGGAWADEPAVLHATGTATVKVIPDTVRVECVVRTEGEDVGNAEQDAGRTVQAVRDALEALKLPGLSVTDTGVAVTARAPSAFERMAAEAPGAGGAPPGGKSPGFTATSTITAEWSGEEAALHANATKLIEAALQAGGDALVQSGPTYFKADDSAERAQAWELAVKNAVLNAQALARGLGVTVTGYSSASMIGPPFSLEGVVPAATTAMSHYVSEMSTMFGGKDTSAPFVLPSEITVTAYVDATYK